MPHNFLNMSRNITLLALVSPKFTEEILEEVLRKATGEIDAKVTDWDFAPGAQEGSNFLSIIYRVIVSGIVKNESIQISTIVKALPHNECSRKTFRSLDFFRNEINFYSKVIPAFENFLKSKGACDLLNVPKCLSYIHDGENDFLVLEDVTTRGFVHIADKQDIWPVENINIILKGLAQFHGIALALHHQNPSEFFNATNDLEEMMFSEKQWQWYRNHYTNMNKIAKSAMTQQYPGSPEEEKFNAITPDELFKKCCECCRTKNDLPIVVNHGDSWAFNFMTRESESGDTDAVIFDFQLARPANLVLDISYFIYTCTDKDTRDKHFDDLLRYYHSELGKIISRLGSIIEDVYPENVFMKDVKEQFILGVAFAVDILPMMLSTEDGLSNIDEVFTSDEAVDISQMWKLNEDLSPDSNKRIADVIVHAIQQGFL